MFCVQRSLRVRDRPASRPAGRSALRSRPACATLAVALLGAAAIGGPARAQAAGCSRCPDTAIHIGPFSFPNPFAAPAPAPAERVQRNGERRGSSDSPSRRRAAAAGHESGARGGGSPGGSVFVCVLTCDGSFFPLPYSGASGASLEEICQALCPNAAVALYVMPFGGTVDQAVSPTGSAYTALPKALEFQQAYETTCSCRRPGQSWADALAAAEARFGHRSHEIVVTAEASARMSRPKPDPVEKPAAAKSASPDDEAPANADAPDLGLDADGVDTKLRAATATISRETSGIKDDDARAGSHFGLKQGQVVDEDAPDGGRRRVRIVTPMF